MKVVTRIKRLIGYSLLSALGVATLVSMLVQGGSNLSFPMILAAIVIVWAVVGIAFVFMKLLDWCFDL